MELTKNKKMDKEVKQVSVAVAIEKIKNGALLIDIREAEEIEMVAYDVDGHMQIPQSEFSFRLNEIPRDREIIIGCHSGNRSLHTTLFLMDQNFDNVFNLKGGIRDWMEQGLPVSWDSYKAKRTVQAHDI